MEVKVESEQKEETHRCDRDAIGSSLDFIGTRSAGLELAIFALEDVPMGSGMAHGADPLDESGLRLQEIEGVVTVTRDSHCWEVG